MPKFFIAEMLTKWKIYGIIIIEGEEGTDGD